MRVIKTRVLLNGLKIFILIVSRKELCGTKGNSYNEFADDFTVLPEHEHHNDSTIVFRFQTY